jgi:hypothetical protein
MGRVPSTVTREIEAQRHRPFLTAWRLPVRRDHRRQPDRPPLAEVPVHEWLEQELALSRLARGITDQVSSLEAHLPQWQFFGV